MDLTPRDIQEKQFHDAFRGYAHEEVDLFLDQVAESFEKVFRQSQVIHHKIAGLEEELGQAKGSEDMLKRMLVTAQETADKAVAEAKAKAQGLISGTEARAQQILTGAEERAADIIKEAKQKAAMMIEDSTRREAELQSTLDALKKFDSDYRARMRTFIESQLQALEKGPDLPAAPVRSTPMPVSTTEAEYSPRVVPKVEAENAVKTENAVKAERVEEPAANGKVQDPVKAIEVPEVKKVPVSTPSQTPQAEQAEPLDEEDRSIRELFWGDE